MFWGWGERGRTDAPDGQRGVAGLERCTHAEGVMRNEENGVFEENSSLFFYERKAGMVLSFHPGFEEMGVKGKLQYLTVFLQWAADPLSWVRQGPVLLREVTLVPLVAAGGPWQSREDWEQNHPAPCQGGWGVRPSIWTRYTVVEILLFTF